MGARIRGELLGRWFEQLCRIKHPLLKEAANAKGNGLRPAFLPSQGGVYAFWWTGDLRPLAGRNRRLSLAGPGGKKVVLEIDDDWLGISAGLPIPLYVGKTAASINKRVGQHLVLKRDRIFSSGGGADKRKAPTTSCQLRAGVEHLFPKKRDTRALVLENVGLSYVILHGDEHAANRFYLEDMSIGLMHPVLNVGVEH
ncbi:MAG TPA: hypothetical protein VM658_12715 [bacterium]|nr:hypothetical protein [bacterium]